MIECFGFRDAYLFGDALAQMFQVRKKIFVDQQGYTVPVWDGMEYDRYDTPAALYGLWRDQSGTGRGVARIAPTTIPYMIEEVWPDFVTTMPLPKSPDIWEATRCGIDPDLPKEQRGRVADELMLAYQEMGLLVGAKALIAVSEPWVWDRMAMGRGWLLEMIGPVREYEGWTLVPVLMPVSRVILARMREHLGIHESVLGLPVANQQRAVAE